MLREMAAQRRIRHPRRAEQQRRLAPFRGFHRPAPAANATQAASSENITFAAPAPLPGKAFFSVLTETP